ncbi:MAG TPA: dipeptide epimerase [bacterium]|nr:dipeptide epimerase [bacterium]
MKVNLRTYDLQLEVPFAIARGTTSVHRICVAELAWRGLTGYGEASPSAYYGDSSEAAAAAILGSEALLGDDPTAIRRISHELRQRYPRSPSGRAAVSAALYDLVGKMAGLPVYRLLGLAGKAIPITSLTVGVDDVDLARRRIHVLKDFPVLKVKVGFGEEEALLDLLKSQTQARLRVDANEGWGVEEAIRKINSWGRYSIEFFEQPLPRADRDGYRCLRDSTQAAIFVDEAVASSEDILQWAGLADGINIKLMKCGGIDEALSMIAVARAAGLKVMLGCMVESSLGISAAAHLAPLVDFCDLDGNLLVANDPFEGVKAAQGRLVLSDLPGFGTTPRT